MMPPKKLNEELERAIDAALTRAIERPQLPAQFRSHLEAALVRAADTKLSDQRTQLEREQRERLAEFETSYVRIRRATLGTMIGGAFAAGAVATFALPWLKASVGSGAPLVLASAGAALGLGIGVASWLQRRRSFGSLP
ncbi:MAG TPA: hypothetical protein VMG11_05145 [Steroidobacteraceae bacterium]|nr:hypothetical protein [Steroidobacteraceae bacterium]